MKIIKLLGNSGLFLITTGLAIAAMILFFDYSLIIEIKNYFSSSTNTYTVPIWISATSTLCINLIGLIFGLLFGRALKTLMTSNEYHAQHQNVKPDANEK